MFKKLDGLEKAKLPIASCLMGEICKAAKRNRALAKNRQAHINKVAACYGKETWSVRTAKLFAKTNIAMLRSHHVIM